MKSAQKFTTFGTVVKSDVLTKELALLKKLELCIELLKNINFELHFHLCKLECLHFIKIDSNYDSDCVITW